jgi:Thioredoxin
MSNIKQIKYSITSFETYLMEGYQKSVDTLQANIATNTESDTKQLEYITNNFNTVKTILKTYEPSASMRAITNKLQEIDVYIIMENWCGSSASNVPFVVKILNTIKGAKIHIVPRDANEDFMNLYLSDGKKSIPIVVAFDKNGNELFKWGSSTAAQSEYAKKLQAQNMEFPDFINAMKKWFLENNAEAIEADFLSLLKQLVSKHQS